MEEPTSPPHADSPRVDSPRVESPRMEDPAGSRHPPSVRPPPLKRRAAGERFGPKPTLVRCNQCAAIGRVQREDARNAFNVVDGHIRPVVHSPFCADHQPLDCYGMPVYRKCTKCKHYHEKHLFIPIIESCVYCCLTTPTHRMTAVNHMHALMCTEETRRSTPMPDIDGCWRGRTREVVCVGNSGNTITMSDTDGNVIGSGTVVGPTDFDLVIFGAEGATGTEVHATLSMDGTLRLSDGEVCTHGRTLACLHALASTRMHAQVLEPVGAECSHRCPFRKKRNMNKNACQPDGVPQLTNAPEVDAAEIDAAEVDASGSGRDRSEEEARTHARAHTVHGRIHTFAGPPQCSATL